MQAEQKKISKYFARIVKKNFQGLFLDLRVEDFNTSKPIYAHVKALNIIETARYGNKTYFAGEYFYIFEKLNFLVNILAYHYYYHYFFLTRLMYMFCFV